MSDESCLINSWTEWGQLELVCVGSARGMCYPDDEYAFPWHEVTNEQMRRYVTSFVGYRPTSRIELAQEQLDNLSNILQSEMVQVKTNLVGKKFDG